VEKISLGIDAETQDILCCELTGNNKRDAEVAEKMLDSTPGTIKSARGDGTYDGQRFHKKVYEKGGAALYLANRCYL